MSKSAKAKVQEDLAKTYNEFKKFGGKKYTRAQRRRLMKILQEMIDQLSDEFEEEEIEKLPPKFRVRHDGENRHMVAM